jgi:phytoene dehydrogenase-like protein
MRASTAAKYDVIIIGGGHNSLVCAAYLAGRGKKVLVLEQRPILGGACVTEPFEHFPEARQTTASYVLSIFPRKIIGELELMKYGLKLLERDPNAFTPLKDGRYFMRYDDLAKTQAEIAKFSEEDAANYPEFAGSIANVARFAEKMMFTTPPDPFRKRDWFKLLGLGRKALGLGEDLYKLIELFSASAHEYITRYVKSEPLVGTLCSDGIIGTCGGPKSPGTAYVLLHHDIGDLSDDFGKWFYVEGGMGSVTRCIAESARAKGVEVRVNADVTRILTEKGRAIGVEVVIEGTRQRIKAETVVSGADAYQTFVKLTDPDDLPPDFLKAVKGIDYTSPTFKINMVIENTGKRKLEWFCDYKGPTPPGTIHILEDTDYLERAYDDSKYGRLSKDLVLEICIPTTKDMTLAPVGYHVISLLGQYVPINHPSGSWNEAARQDLLERTLAKMSEYCNIREVFVTADILTPKDLEEKFRLTGGNIFQGGMALKQLFNMRPLPGWARYRSPIKGLWICGSAAHPGGGVTGIPGHNAAREILKGW